MLLSRTTILVILVQCIFALVTFTFITNKVSPLSQDNPICVIVSSELPQSSTTASSADTNTLKTQSIQDIRSNNNINIPISENKQPDNSKQVIINTIDSKSQQPPAINTPPPIPSKTPATPTLNYDSSKHSNTRLFFSVNSGRVGSGYIFKLLEGAGISKPFHEGKPAMSGDVLFNASKMGLEATRPTRMEKIKAIQSSIASISPTVPAALNMYAETSHLFYKTFWDLTLEVLLPHHHIYVLLLSRYLPLVLSSHEASKVWGVGCANDDDPKFSYVSYKYWYYNPAFSKLSLTYPNPPPSCDNAGIEIAMSYLIDVEIWQQMFKKRYADHPNITIIEARLEALQNEENVYNFFNMIDIPKSEILSSRQVWLKSRVIGKGYNVRKKTTIRPKPQTPQQLQQAQAQQKQQAPQPVQPIPQTQPQTLSQLQHLSRQRPDDVLRERPKRQIFPGASNAVDDLEKYRLLLENFIATRYPGQEVEIPSMQDYDPEEHKIKIISNKA